MKFLRTLFQRPPPPPSLSVREWILAQTGTDLEVTEVGPFETAEGQVVCLDPLAFYQVPAWVQVPKAGGELVVFHDTEQGRNSKAAIIFGDEVVAGGADVGTCGVDAGMASFFTPASHAAMTAFVSEREPHWNAYDDYFNQFDDPQGGERKIATLPDGTPVPYIHSGWGDGGYPVATLTDVAGVVIAIYVDFMGTGSDGAWLLPPGVSAT